MESDKNNYKFPIFHVISYERGNFSNLSTALEIEYPNRYNAYAFIATCVFSIIASATMIVLLFRKPDRKRIDHFFIHFAFANLLVTFLMMKGLFSYGWQSTNLACRSVMFFKYFGSYLTAFVLVCIAIDRFSDARNPVKLNGGGKGVALATTWILAVLFCLPTVFMFHVREVGNSYIVCICTSYGTDPRLLYIVNIASFSCMFALPSLVIIFLHAFAYLELSNKHRHMAKMSAQFGAENAMAYRRKQFHTLNLTFTMAVLFVVCKTPITLSEFGHTFINTDTESYVGFYSVYSVIATAYCFLNPIVFIIFHVKERLNIRAAIKPTSE